MTSTLNPTCPLCGLRYESMPLLELHVREDHRQRRHAQPGRLKMRLRRLMPVHHHAVRTLSIE